MESITRFFGYRPLDTPLHKLDGRVKLLWYFSFVIPAVAWSDPLYLSILLLILLGCGLIARESLKVMLKTLILPFPGYILIFLFNIFAFDITVKKVLTWEPYYIGWAIPKIGPYGPLGHVSVEGLVFATGVCLRLAIFILASRLLLRTTSPFDIVASLRKLRVPMEICLAISVAFGYLPELARQVVTILEAQKSRGWKVESKNPIKVVRGYVPVAVPIISRSMSRAEYLAAAIASKGFGATSNPIPIREIKLTTLDYVVTMILVLMLVTGITLGSWILGYADFRFTSFIVRGIIASL